MDRPAVESLSITARRFNSKRDETLKVGESEQQLLFLPKTSLELRLQTSQSVSNAEVLGAGFVVEKRFKHGREYLESLHVAVSSLAQVEHLENGRAILTQPRKD